MHAFDFHWTGDDIPANPSMIDLTLFVRRAVFNQNHLHSEVQRLSAVCASNQTELQRQRALLEAQAVTIAELQGEQVAKSRGNPTVVITDQGEGCKKDMLRKRQRDDQDDEGDLSGPPKQQKQAETAVRSAFHRSDRFIFKV